MDTSQKLAIWYKEREKIIQEQERLIIKKDGSLENFNNSRYKTKGKYLFYVYGVSCGIR